MAEVKLEILYPKRGNNGILDIYDSKTLPLAIQYGIKNVTNLDESKGAYTKTFDIPATKHNNKLLKHALKDGLADVVQFVDESIKCRVRVDGQNILTGTFTIKSYIKGAKEIGYTITVMGDNNNWTSILDGKMMCETIEAELNQVHQWTDGLWRWYNENRTVDDINHPTGMPTYDICIPHICWGEYGYDHTPATWKKSMLQEQTPAFFIKKLVNAYFNEAGYEVVSQFMNTKFFKKLIMPTDPQRFNHGNIDTLGGGTQTSTVVVAEAEFYHDTGQGVGIDTMGFIYCGGGTGFDSPNFPLHPNPLCFDATRPAATINHSTPIGWVKWGSYAPKFYQWWGDRMANFNVEVLDIYNVQDVYTHQTTPDLTWQDQSKHLATGYPKNNGWGEAQDHEMYTSRPMRWHKWICPTTANYEIDVQVAVGCWKQGSQVSDGRANCQLQLRMFEGSSGFNYDDNSSLNTYASTMGVDTLLASDSATTPGSQQFRTYRYRELDVNWSGTIPAGAMIVVELRTKNDHNTDWYSHCILLDHDFTMWDAGWRVDGMTGVKARRSFFRISTGTQINYGDDVTWANYLPCDITQKKFISGLTGLFNLYWYTDEQSKKVYVEPYESFYKTKAQSVNWKNKLDLNKPHQTKFLTDILSRYALYRYQKPNKDQYQKTLNDTLEHPYAAQFLDLGAQYINNTKEYGTSQFVPTIMIHDNELVELVTEHAPWVPLIVKEWIDNIGQYNKPERTSGYGMRILSYEGMQSTGDQPMYSAWKSGGIGETTEYPRAQSYALTNVPQAGQEHANLQYHDVENSGTQGGLFTTFFDTMFQDLIQLPRMKIGYFYLTPKDISQLDLRNLVYITEDGGANGSYWKIHKIIDYKPHEDGLTKVELLQYQIKDTSLPRLTGGGGIGPIVTGPGRGEPTGGTHGLVGGLPHDNNNEPQPHVRPRPTKGKSLIINANNKAPRDNGNIMLGQGLTTRLQNQIVLGQFNKLDNNAILIIGGGTNENNRRNVLTVKQDGSIHLGEHSTNLVTKDDTGAYIDLYTEDKDADDNLTINKVT